MEILTNEFQTYLEKMDQRVERLEGKLEAIQNPTPKQDQKRKKNLGGVKKLSQATGVSVSTLIRHRNNGIIEGFRFGGRIFYDIDKVLNEMQSTLKIKKKGPHHG